MQGEIGEAISKVLLTGDTSPQSMTNLVNLSLFGKAAESETTETSTTTDSSDEKTEGSSQQITGNPFERMAPGEYVQPKYNPDVWAAAMDQNTRLGRSIRTFARNTVGLGWYIEPIHKITPKTPEEEREIVAEETKILHRLFERPNEDMPITQLFYLVKVDEEATGDGYIEITRNASGKIDHLFHAPTVTMRIRVRKVGSNVKVGGFVQIRGNEKRYFKEFGDKKVMKAATGEYYTGSDPLPIGERASEMIHFRIYSPTSTWYGSPRYVSAAPAISGNRLAAIRNVNFFSNDATPRLAVLVSGGRLDPLSMQQIEDFIKAKTSGVENAHRVMVLQAEGQKVGFQQQAPVTKIDLQPLTVGVTEDSSFNTYREANDEEVREAFGIARIFYSADDVNKSCFVEDTRIPLLDGRSLTMGELVKEYGTNGTFWVYSKDKMGNVVPGKAHSPRKTKIDTEVWEVLLDNGETIKGTPDHLFMLLDGTYKELAQLEPGDRLNPLYRYAGKTGNCSSRYYFYKTNGMKKFEPVHRMVARCSNGGIIPEGMQVHHVSGDTLNNTPSNLKVLTHSNHATENGHQRWANTTFEERKSNMLAALSATTFNIPFEKMKEAAKPGMSWKQLGDALGIHRDTAMKKVNDYGMSCTEFRDTYMPHIDGVGTQKRFDVKLGDILEAASSSKSIQQVAKRLGVSTTFVNDELKRSGWTWRKVMSEVLGTNVGTGENHKVVRVRPCGTADVYDITVDEYHNFALQAGVFVHNSAEISRALTNEQEFEPDRLEKEYIINQKIVTDLLKSFRGEEDETSEESYTPHVRFRFERMKLTDPLDTAQLNQAYAQMGALTPNELREAIGKPPYPDEYAFANKPLQVAMQELSAGLAMAIVGEKRDAIPGGDQSAQIGMQPGDEQGGDQGIAPGQMEAGEEQIQPGAEGESGTAESAPVSQPAESMPQEEQPQEEAKAGDYDSEIHIGKTLGGAHPLPPMDAQARVMALQSLIADVQSFAQSARLPYIFQKAQEQQKVHDKKS